MHELSIAESALGAALDHARQAGASQIRLLVIRVGALSGVDPEALQSAFAVILPGSPAEGAAVQIDEVPALAYCAGCKQEFEPDTQLVFECPVCGRLSTEVRRGRELDLVRLEML